MTTPAERPLAYLVPGREPVAELDEIKARLIAKFPQVDGKTPPLYYMEIAEEYGQVARDLGRRLAEAEERAYTSFQIGVSWQERCKAAESKLASAVAAERRYNWLRENGDKGIYLLQNWSQGDTKPILALAQGAELDSIIDTNLAAAIRGSERDGGGT